jgi:hypothetical protein
MKGELVDVRLHLTDNFLCQKYVRIQACLLRVAQFFSYERE